MPSRNRMAWLSEANNEELLARDWNAFELKEKKYIQLTLEVTVNARIMGYMCYYVFSSVVSPYACHKTMTPLVYTASEKHDEVSELQEKSVILKYRGPGVDPIFPPSSRNFSLGQLAERRERRSAGGLKMAEQYLPTLRQAAEWDAMWVERLPSVRQTLNAFFKGEEPDLQELFLEKMRGYWLDEAH